MRRVNQLKQLALIEGTMVFSTVGRPASCRIGARVAWACLEVILSAKGTCISGAFDTCALFMSCVATIPLLVRQVRSYLLFEQNVFKAYMLLD